MPEGDIANHRLSHPSTNREQRWEITPLIFGQSRLILTDGITVYDGY